MRPAPRSLRAPPTAAPAWRQGTVGVGQSGWLWGNPQPQGNTLRAVEFAGGVGYAAGDFGTLLRTPDNGTTWQGIPTGIVGNLAQIRAVNANTVLIGSGCVMRRSDDGGTTFRRVPFVSRRRAAAPVSPVSTSRRPSAATSCSPTAPCRRRPTAAVLRRRDRASGHARDRRSGGPHGRVLHHRDDRLRHRRRRSSSARPTAAPRGARASPAPRS